MEKLFFNQVNNKKMKELKLEHIAKRLPYGLKGVITRDKSESYIDNEWYNENDFKSGVIWNLTGVIKPNKLNIPIGEGYLQGLLWSRGNTYVNFHRDMLPILRPLSDSFNKPLFGMINETDKPENLLVWQNERLLEHHYDVDDLISQGLAIDVNTLGINPYK